MPGCYYRGDIDEYGDAAAVTERPEHAHTKRLLLASEAVG